MPKRLTENGDSINYQPTVIRFTETQKNRLVVQSKIQNTSVNNLVRRMVENELTLYERVSENLVSAAA